MRSDRSLQQHGRSDFVCPRTAVIRAQERYRKTPELEIDAVHRPSPGRMRRQPSIVFGFLDEILRTRALIVEPRQQSDPVVHIGDQDAIAVFRRVEQLILFGIFRRRRLLLFDVAQGDEPVRMAPPLRLIPEFALTVGIGLRRTGPLRRFQFVDQPRGLARRDDESGSRLLIRLYGFVAIESGIGTRINRLRAFRNGGEYAFQMTSDLFAGGPVPIAQFARYVLPYLGQKGQNRQTALGGSILVHRSAWIIHA